MWKQHSICTISTAGSWAQALYNKTCDQKDKDAYNVFTEKEMSLIPEWEVASYAETEGRQYCVTRLQLGMADLYVTDWIGCQILRKWYHDRPLYIVMTDAVNGVLIKRMMERGSTEQKPLLAFITSGQLFIPFPRMLPSRWMK